MVWNPQKAVGLAPVPIVASDVIVSTETNDVILFMCPDNAGYRIEILSVSLSLSVAPAISTGTVTIDLETVDDSASDAKSEIASGSATAYDLEGATVNVTNELWRGSVVLDPGDTLNAEFVTGTTVSTQAEGLTFLVEYRILDRS